MKENSLNHYDSPASRDRIQLLYEEYKEPVFSFAYKHLKSTHRSHDIVQEVFFALCQKDLTNVENIRSFIFQITHHKVVDQFRNQARNRALRSEMWSVIERTQRGAHHAMVDKEYREQLEKAKDKLTPQQRIIFDLSRTEGLSHQKIAEKMDLSPNTVKNHMVSALKTLREYLRINSDVVISLLLFALFF